MASRNWKNRQPASLRQAMEWCLAYAREQHNHSVDRVADRMGLANKWALYKWMESGRLPAILIQPFERACGIDYVTRYVAYSAHKLLIDIPAGKPANSGDINALQGSFAEAISLLLQFYGGKATADETVSALTSVMTGLGSHRENVRMHGDPELALFEEDAP